MLENECEGLRQAHVDVLNDMSVCRSKEAELLAYTQQVTEKNVALQSKLSSIEAKVHYFFKIYTGLRYNLCTEINPFCLHVMIVNLLLERCSER